MTSGTRSPPGEHYAEAAGVVVLLVVAVLLGLAFSGPDAPCPGRELVGYSANGTPICADERTP